VSVFVYLGLGGNVGDVQATLQEAVALITALSAVHDVNVSQLYRTSPVGGVSQPDFINGACRLLTTTPVRVFHGYLQEIERVLGKNILVKNGPRTIDIDILFFGKECINDADLTVPHPRWQERLFVLMPLAELTREVAVVDGEGVERRWDVAEMLNNFCNVHHERVVAL